jgi:hypothetical protein
MDNSFTIIIAIMFILIIYLQLQITQIKNDNLENFDASSDNVTAINNLGTLANSILTGGKLNIPGDTTISGGTLKINNIESGYSTSIEKLGVVSTHTDGAWGMLWGGGCALIGKEGNTIRMGHASDTKATNWKERLNISATGGVTIPGGVYIGDSATIANAAGNTLVLSSTNSASQVNQFLFNTYPNTNLLMIRANTANGTNGTGGWSEPIFTIDSKGNMSIPGNLTIGKAGAEYTLISDTDAFRIASGPTNDANRYAFKRNAGQKNYGW